MPFFFTALVSYNSGKEGYRWAAFILLFIASLSDALDGALARVLNKKSKLGRFLDPLADKLLLLSGYLGLLYVSSLTYVPPLWITVTIVFRDIIIIVGLVTIYFISGEVRVEPNLLGKTTTAFQMGTLIAILLQWKIAVVFWYITAVLTILSLLVYVIRDIKLLNGHAK